MPGGAASCFATGGSHAPSEVDGDASLERQRRAHEAARRARAREASDAAEADGRSGESLRLRCVAGCAEPTARGGTVFDRGRSSRNDGVGGNRSFDPCARDDEWVAVVRGRQRRSAAEELAIGRAYSGPRMDPRCCKIKTPGKFADALEATGFSNARFIEELREFEFSGGFNLGYLGPLDAQVVCENPAATWDNAVPLHAQYQADLAAGTLLLFESLADVKATWAGFRVSPGRAIPKMRFGLRRFVCRGCGEDGVLRLGVAEVDARCGACGSADVKWKYRSIFNLSKRGPNGELSLNDWVPCDDREKIELGRVAHFGEELVEHSH